ncbi:MAG: hypothetical protein ACR2N6_09015 [Miltoncostaeaceae bacterium]
MDSTTARRVRRLVVIANETCAGAAVVQEVSYRAGSGAEVIVVAPALPSSRLKHWLGSDSADARAAAESRLADSVRALERAGLRARGHLGDGDPLQALDDVLRIYGPDEVVISTHPPSRSHWLERDVVARARQRYGLPITHVVVDVEHESGLARTDGAPEPPAPQQMVRVYCETDYAEALDIRQQGFRDLPQEGGVSGVVVTDRPDNRSATSEDPVLFGLDIPASALEGKVLGEAGEGPRRYLLSAGLLNRHGPAIAVGEWSE